MHEMALCTEIVDVVMKEAEQADAVSINDVCIVIGEMRDIVEDLFDGFFHYLTRGTIAENARILYERIPTTASCKSCKAAYPLAIRSRQEISCPACHSKEYDVKTGMEFYIDSIDITTEDELA